MSVVVVLDDDGLLRPARLSVLDEPEGGFGEAMRFPFTMFRMTSGKYRKNVQNEHREIHNGYNSDVPSERKSAF
jgi:hypothetical protein